MAQFTPIESIRISISENEKDEKDNPIGPLVVVALLSKDTSLMEAKFPAEAFNTPSGYGHAIDLTIMQYQHNAQKDNSGDTTTPAE